MHRELLEAYNSLTPKDQGIIDIMILTICEKEKKLRDMAREVMEFIRDGKEDL